MNKLQAPNFEIVDVTYDNEVREAASLVVKAAIGGDFALKDYDTFRGSNCTDVFAAVQDKTLILGALGVQKNKAKDLFVVERLGVKKEFQVHGIGSILLAHACQFAVDKGYCRVELTAANDSSGFYEKHGFYAPYPDQPALLQRDL